MTFKLVKTRELLSDLCYKKYIPEDMPGKDFSYEILVTVLEGIKTIDVKSTGDPLLQPEITVTEDSAEIILPKMGINIKDADILISQIKYAEELILAIQKQFNSL